MHNKGTYLQGSIYIYIPHLFIWLKRQACADAYAAAAATEARTRTAVHALFCSLGVVAGGASTRRAHPHPLPPVYPLAVAMERVSGSKSGKALSNGKDRAGFTLLR
jgi:hypothetical protein